MRFAGRTTVLVVLVSVGAGLPVLAAPASAKPPKPKAQVCRATVQVPEPSISTTSTTRPCIAAENLATRDAAGDWKGVFTVRSLATVPRNSCTGAFRGTVSIVVRTNGTITGGAEATATELPACTVSVTRLPPTSGVSLTVSGGFDQRAFELRFVGTALDPANSFEAGFHVLYYPGPPTLRIPLVSTSRAVGVIDLFNGGPEELAGGGGTASLVGKITIQRAS